MSATREVFEKNGKSHNMLKLVRDGKGGEKFPFSFGASKARLILAHLDDIRKFADDNPPQQSGAGAGEPPIIT